VVNGFVVILLFFGIVNLLWGVICHGSGG